MNRTVSTIVPTYNRADLLGQTLSSLQSQTYDDHEIIVVDDASSDRTEELVQRTIAIDSRVRYVRQDSNQGVGAARLEGHREAKGAFLQFIDSDDVAHPSKLAIQVQVLEAAPDVDIAICQTMVFATTPGDTDFLWNTFDGPDHVLRLAKHDLPWQTGAPLYRRETLDRMGSFRTDLGSSDDFELAFRCRVLGARMHFDPRILLYYRVHPNQIVRTREPDRYAAHYPIYKSIAELMDSRGMLTSEIRITLQRTLLGFALERRGSGDSKRASDWVRAAAEFELDTRKMMVLLATAAKCEREDLSEREAFAEAVAEGYEVAQRVDWFMKFKARPGDGEIVPIQRRYGERRRDAARPAASAESER